MSTLTGSLTQTVGIALPLAKYISQQVCIGVCFLNYQ